VSQIEIQIGKTCVRAFGSFLVSYKGNEMKPFDIDQVLAGKPVVTRGNEPVMIGGVNSEADKHHQVIGWYNGECAGWSLAGEFDVTPSNMDLFMKTEEIEIKAFLNIYADGKVAALASKEAADKYAQPDRIACVPFSYTYRD
jgi:hypothetical protein